MVHDNDAAFRANGALGGNPDASEDAEQSQEVSALKSGPGPVEPNGPDWKQPREGHYDDALSESGEEREIG